MNLGQMLHTFFADDKVQAALLVVFADLVLGVLAAWKLRTFRLSYLADFGRNDILFKLLPYFLLYAGALVAGHAKILLPGLDMGVVAGAAYVAFMAAWAGSILSSLAELGVPVGKLGSIHLAGAENAAPPKD